jgi:ATP-binding cassette subfamily F protein 3
MIQVENLTFNYADRVLFDQVSFSLMKGEKLGLIGRNGAGKSTLFRLLTKLENGYEGKIIIPKDYSIGYLDQHIQFKKETVLDEALTVLPQDGTMDHLAKKILIGLGFLEAELSNPISSFSGGYQLRLHLAKVLLKEPMLLLLDEPTNYLDLPSQTWLMQYLKNYPGEIILITHDRYFMDQVCGHILGLHRQKLKKIKGKTIDYFEKVLADEELYEKNRLNQQKKAEHLQEFVDRFKAKATKAKQAQSRLKVLEKMPVLEKLNALENLSFSFHDAPIASKLLVSLENISFSYEQEKPLITDFNLEIQKGEIIAIIGKNGFGKSTLLKLIGSELNPISGSVKMNPALKIGYFGQTHIQRLNPKMTILEEIHHSNPLLTQQEVKSICGSMLFGASLMEKKIEVLSGGEKSRVLLGKILSKPCNLFLLDEPTHHLDMESIEALIDAISMSESAFVIVTHSEEILKRLSIDKIIFCQKEKQKIFLGDYDDFLRSNQNAFTQEEKTLVKVEKSSKDYEEIKNLQSQIRRLEKQIIDKEKELEGLEKKLLEECQKGERNSIKDLKLQEELKAFINQSFEKLTILDELLNSKKDI